MATIMITGGTGLIGTALTRELVNRGYEVIILTRNIKNKRGAERVLYAEWNIENQTIDVAALAKADYIIHLAGANVAEKRWTKARKREIVESRVKSGALLVKTLQEIPNKVQALVSASAIGWYGPDKGSGPFEETDGPADDFLGTICRQWEEAVEPVTQLQKRLVILRTGIVLSNNGGAYPEFKKTLRFRIASILGSGKQVISWIHSSDLIRLYIAAIENKNMKGVYNAVAPNPVNNTMLTRVIASVLSRRYICVHVPVFILKIMLGEMSMEVLKSTTVSSQKAEATGFRFAYRTIDEAVKNLEGKIKG